MRWFRARACSVFHFINGYSEGNKVHMDMCVSDLPAFEFMREAGGLHVPQQEIGGGLFRWTFVRTVLRTFLRQSRKIGHGSDVGKLVGIDHGVDRLDHAVGDVEREHADHAPFGVIGHRAGLAIDPGQPEGCV